MYKNSERRFIDFLKPYTTSYIGSVGDSEDAIVVDDRPSEGTVKDQFGTKILGVKQVAGFFRVFQFLDETDVHPVRGEHLVDDLACGGIRVGWARMR